jgi:hypothetical protein
MQLVKHVGSYSEQLFDWRLPKGQEQRFSQSPVVSGPHFGPAVQDFLPLSRQ